jgi:hypothetical protein
VQQDGGVTDSTDPTPHDPVTPLDGEDAGAPPIPSVTAPAPRAAPRTDGSAVAALVVAILSWFLLPIVGSVVALVLARSAERSIEAAPLEVSGRGLVTAARWVAWTHLVVVAMVIAFIAAFVIAVWIGR